MRTSQSEIEYSDGTAYRTVGGYGVGEEYLGVWREFFEILRLLVADAEVNPFDR